MNRDEIPSGTMHMLILRSLARNGKMHGFEIAKFIEGVSADVLRLEEGTLYPALQRMLMKGWVTSEWGRDGGKPTGAILPFDSAREETIGSGGG